VSFILYYYIINKKEKNEYGFSDLVPSGVYAISY